MKKIVATIFFCSFISTSALVAAIIDLNEEVFENLVKPGHIPTTIYSEPDMNLIRDAARILQKYQFNVNETTIADDMNTLEKMKNNAQQPYAISAIKKMNDELTHMYVNEQSILNYTQEIKEYSKQIDLSELNNQFFDRYKFLSYVKNLKTYSNLLEDYLVRSKNEQVQNFVDDTHDRVNKILGHIVQSLIADGAPETIKNR